MKHVVLPCLGRDLLEWEIKLIIGIMDFNSRMSVCTHNLKITQQIWANIQSGVYPLAQSSSQLTQVWIWSALVSSSKMSLDQKLHHKFGIVIMVFFSSTYGQGFVHFQKPFAPL